MSTSIQPLAKGMQNHVEKKQHAKESGTDFEKLMSNLKKAIKSEGDGGKKGSAEEEGTSVEEQNETVLTLALGLQGNLNFNELKQLTLKGKTSDAGLHGFTKEELLKVDPNLSQKNSQENQSQKAKAPSQAMVEGELQASEVKLNMGKMLEKMEPVLGKQYQSDLLSFLRQKGIELPAQSLTPTSVTTEQPIQVEALSNLTAEEVDKVQTKTVVNDQLIQTASKEEMPVVRARQFSDDFGQLLDRIQVMKNGKESQLRIKLSPESLGQLDIRLTTVDGKVTAHIATSTAAAKDMIEAQLHQLRQTLVQQGIQLDKVEVVQQSSQSLFQDSQQQQGQQFEQGKYRHQKQSEQYEVEENPLVTQEQEEETDGINYSV